jgi:hypothetical protein
LEPWRFYCLLAIPIPIGVASVAGEMVQMRRVHDDLLEFLNDFVQWCNERGKNHERYERLVRRSGVIQSHLGASGRGLYRPPSQGFAIHNYAIVINGLPELRDGFRRLETHSYAANIPESIDAIDGCIRREVGALDEALSEARRRFGRPIFLYVRGVRAVLSVPFAILTASGLLPETSAAAGWLLRFLTAIGTLALTAIAVLKGLRSLDLI